MKISTEIDSIAQLVGEEKAIELCAKAGFQGWDFSLFSMCRYDRTTKSLLDNDHPLAGPDYLAFARQLKRVADDNGIRCNQSHAPFPTAHPGIRSCFQRAIECTAEAGGQICVIHPNHNDTPEQNAEMYWELLPFAKQCGVKIATENMFTWLPEQDTCVGAACATPESFVAHVDAVNDPDFVACLDIGHGEMAGSGTRATELVYALGHRLQALHIHDNDLRHDRHQIPFSMDIDFVPIVKALKDIGYRGWFTLEADSYLAAFTRESAWEGVQNLANAAKRLAEMFENA